MSAFRVGAIPPSSLVGDHNNTIPPSSLVGFHINTDANDDVDNQGGETAGYVLER